VGEFCFRESRARGKYWVVQGAGKVVDNLNLGNFVKKIDDYDVFSEGEIFYRGMSQADYQYLLANGKIRAPLNSPTSSKCCGVGNGNKLDDYLYSSARNCADLENLLDVVVLPPELKTC